MTRASLVAAAAVLLLATSAAGHGAVTYPPPREAIDANETQFYNGMPPYPLPFEFVCAKPSHHPDGRDPRNLTGANGQACFWFNNGCDISCDECDGTTGQLIHPKFIYDGPTGGNTGWTGRGIVPDPNATQPGGGVNARAICAGKPKRNATICDPNMRTINTNAECGSADDFYFYAPWRAPGTAPVIDACGVAGGRLEGQGPGAAGADYMNTSHARRGDRGSLLPRAPSNTTWTAGQVVEVAWTVKAFHGGGYSYRLCPADGPLTEDCFQRRPLRFVGQQSFRWGGLGGKQIWFDGTYAVDGVHPPGSMWAKNPVPAGPWGWKLHGATFEPKCDEPAACRAAVNQYVPQMTCQCSGDGIGDIPTLELVDHVQLPADLPEGEWVLGWRWDCEESTQVWSSCSDVTIRSA